MKISQEHDRINYSLVDNDTGEVSNLTATKVITNHYYSIKGLRTKISMKSFAEAQSLICKSSIDIQLFWYLMQRTERNLLIVNQKDISDVFEVRPEKISRFIKKMIEVDFLKKKQQGIYMVNPIFFKSPKTTNDMVEQLQKDWEE